MRGWLALASLVSTLTGCAAQPQPAPVQRLRIATGDAAGGAWFYTLGTALARLYNERMPGVDVVAEQTEASVANVNAIASGTADLALARADLVYAAYTDGTSRHPGPHRQLRGIAVLYVSTLQIVVRADSPFNDAGDLRSARIAYSLPAEEEEARVQDAVLLTIGPFSNGSNAGVVRLRFHEITEALSKGTIDAGFLLAGYPLTVISNLSNATGIRLLDIKPDAIRRIRARSPFYRPATIPSGTYAGQSESVRTVGVEILMVCREDLDETLVYQMTRTLFDNLDAITYPGGMTGALNPDLASATPVPLHRGAARYYRERELLD